MVFHKQLSTLMYIPKSDDTGRAREHTGQGWENNFLSGNLGRRLEIFCKICNVTITKITKQMHNYCIICTLVIIGYRLVFVCSYIAIVVCYIPQL